MEYLFLALSTFISWSINSVGRFRRRRIKRILLFKLDHLGDFITALPAIARLRSVHPTAEITLVVGSWVAPIAEGQPGVDHIIVYDSPRYSRVGTQGGGKLSQLLAGFRPDLIVGLRDDWASLRYSIFAGAVHRFDRGGVRVSAKVGSLRFRRGRAGKSNSMHEVETNLRIVGVNDFSVERRPSLQVREDVATEISEMIRDRLPSCRHYVVIHPGAISPLRCWSSHRFIEVIRWIRESTDLGVVVTGSSSEKALAEEIVSDTRSGVISLAGETSLIQVVAVISGALAMVSVDTGVMHIATAVGTPVIALVGPEDPNRFGPYGRENAVLYHNYSCSPCDQVNCVRGRPECMETITTDEVIGALRRVLVGAGFDYGGS